MGLIGVTTTFCVVRRAESGRTVTIRTTDPGHRYSIVVEVAQRRQPTLAWYFHWFWSAVAFCENSLAPWSDNEWSYRGARTLGDPIKVTRESDTPILAGEYLARHHHTYGFPIQAARIVAERFGWEVDEVGYEEAMREHRAKSQG